MPDGTPGTEAIRCLVADDHPALLLAVCDALRDVGIDVVATAADGREALEKIQTMRPSIAVLDLRMPKLSGIDVARETARVSPSTGVILFTGEADKAMLAESVDAGVRGYVLKEAPLDDLVRAIRTVGAGGTYVDAVLSGAVLSGRAAGQLAELTSRERDVLRLLADGLGYEQIGKVLFIAPETVRAHVKKAMGRLEANTRTQAVATALRQSLIG
jgi:DNA-binding NarL/FixJ family response regulator